MAFEDGRIIADIQSREVSFQYPWSLTFLFHTHSILPVDIALG
jgi:hypothetical protein